MAERGFEVTPLLQACNRCTGVPLYSNVWGPWEDWCCRCGKRTNIEMEKYRKDRAIQMETPEKINDCLWEEAGEVPQ